MNPEASEWIVEFFLWNDRWSGCSNMVSFAEAAREAKRREDLSLFTYRIRNARTNDILPAAIL